MFTDIVERDGDEYLRHRGFECSVGHPGKDEHFPYVEIMPSSLLPDRYNLWFMTGNDTGVPLEIRKNSVTDGIEEAVGLIAETAMERCEIPKGRRIKVFAHEKCEDIGMLLPERYGGML